MVESKKQGDPNPLDTFVPPKEGEAIRSEQGKKHWYHVVKELGRGGMGVVLLVKDQATKKEYAMKCEKKGGKYDPTRRLKLEALAMLGFRARSSKHLVQAIDYGAHNDFTFIVMPLIWKTLADLEKYMDGEVFSKSTAIQIAIQTLQGVAAMHDLGLLHRDIKPANIALGKQRTTVYLLDFGMCRYTRQDDGCHLRNRGQIQFGGTVFYSSLGGMHSHDQSRADDVETWFYVMFPYISMKKGTDLDMPTDEEIKEEILRTKESDKTKKPLAEAELAKESVGGMNMLAKLLEVQNEEQKIRKLAGAAKDDAESKKTSILSDFKQEEVINAQNSLVVQKKIGLMEKGPKAGLDLPLAVNIIREYIIGLTWYDRPDYEYILQLLKDTDTVEKWCDLEEPLDWLKPGIAAKIAEEDGGKKKDDKSLSFQ